MIGKTGGAAKPGVAAVVLAAGAGTRLGTPKALVRFGERLLVERAVAAAGQAGCDPVLVVLGAEAPRVRREADLRPATVLDNPHWREGQSTSLRIGLQALLALPSSCPTVAVVLLVDQPFVGAAAIRAVTAAGRGADDLAAARYAGRPGHPILLGRSHWQPILAGLAGDSGARHYLADHREELTLVPCDSLAAPDDVDTPADLDSALKRSRLAPGQPRQLG